MRPGIQPGQLLGLIAMLVRRPLPWLNANARLIGRGLFYFSQNPDLAWAARLMADVAQRPDFLLLVGRGNQPVFSLLLSMRGLGNVSLDGFEDLDSFRQKCEAGLDQPLQAVMVDAGLFDRLHAALADRKEDAFFIAGREVLAMLAERQIRFSPVMLEAEIGASLNGSELLAKFGPRYGVGIKNPVTAFGIAKGIWFVIKSPWTDLRMKSRLARRDA